MASIVSQCMSLGLRSAHFGVSSGKIVFGGARAHACRTVHSRAIKDRRDATNGIEIDYKNVEFLSQFVTDQTGQIKSRMQTGLTAKQQRKVSKAIKRARCFGLMPYTYKLEFFREGERQ